MKRWLSNLLAPRVLWPLLALAARLLFLTIRIRDNSLSAAFKEGRGPGQLMAALWHAHQLAALWNYRGLGVVLLASQHRDAEYAARTARSLGYRVARGSSSRGGARALMELARLARGGHSIALTCDGPLGPPHVVKIGIIHLARQAGLPVTPLAIGLANYWKLSSWDGFRIPKPFSRGYALLGEPIAMPKNGAREEIETARLELERRLRELEPLADRLAREG